MAIDVRDATHLLKRSGFGVPKALLGELLALPTIEAAVDRVLDVSRNPSTADLPTIPKGQSDFNSWMAIMPWWMERMRTSPVPIVEKMTLFWHNHFPASVTVVPDMNMLRGQHLTLRAHATGSFHDLTQAIAVDPTMLFYLDNAWNIVGKPQENFARELVELFTLGPGNYTQDDVVALARAWTGHTLDPATVYRTYKYHGPWHDNGTKTLFGKSANWDGPATITEILRGAKAVAASRFVTAKLFSHLAYPVSPDDAVVAPLADAFRAADLSILALLRAIFTSDAFWSDEARQARPRSPIEFFVAAMQATNLTTAECIPHRWLDRMGHVPFGIPDVSGWKQDDYWLSTNGAFARSHWGAWVRFMAWNAGLLGDLWTKPTPTAVTEACAQFGIAEPAAATRAALETMVDACKAQALHWAVAPQLILILLLSPDFLTA